MPAGNQFSVLDSRDIIADFYPKLEAANESLWSNSVSITIPSTRAVEEFAWLGQVPAMRKWIGGRTEEPVNKYTMSITNYDYEATLAISVPDLRRDKTGQLRQRVADLAVRTATHKNKLAGDLITAGEAGTISLAYDGQYFYDSDHNESGSNQTNTLGATEVPASNVATTSTLTTAEAADIITQTIAYMMTYTDDKGEPINQAITDVKILVTKQGHFVGIKNALSLANLGTGSGNNNPILAWGGINISVEYVPTRITAADKLYFFLGTPGMGTAPVIFTEENGVQTQLIGAGSEEEFKNNRHLFGVTATRGCGYGMWQRSAVVTLT